MEHSNLIPGTYYLAEVRQPKAKYTIDGYLIPVLFTRDEVGIERFLVVGSNEEVMPEDVRVEREIV